MPRIRFVGDSATCAWLGVNFAKDQWTDHALAPEDLDRVAKHPHFEVEGVAKAPKPPSFAPAFAEASAGKDASAGKKA